MKEKKKSRKPTLDELKIPLLDEVKEKSSGYVSAYGHICDPPNSFENEYFGF